MKIVQIVHRGLARFHDRGDSSKLDQRLVDKLRKQLEFLQAMEVSDELIALPTWKPHRLSDGRWSIHVTANWRMTFRNDAAAGEISILDPEDYH
nr:type II toxin-antitoxin system RelE/ParE family toxin [Polymorphobacter sp.]